MAETPTGPGGDRARGLEQTNAHSLIANTDDDARARRWCRYCDAYRLKLGRAERRKLARLARLARPGEAVPQWLTAHRDNCPASTQLNTPGWHAAGRVRSPFKGADRG